MTTQDSQGDAELALLVSSLPVPAAESIAAPAACLPVTLCW